MSIGYAWEKLFTAVIGMAQSPASIQERIADAYIYNLVRIVPERDLPPDLRPLLVEIREALTPEAGDGSAQAAARAMSQDQAVEVARKIVTLYDRVSAANDE